MQVKDLKNRNLGGVKVRTPGGVEGYWVSQWQQGVFLTKDYDSIQQILIPVPVDDLKDTLEWEVLENSNL